MTDSPPSGSPALDASGADAPPSDTRPVVQGMDLILKIADAQIPLGELAHRQISKRMAASVPSPALAGSDTAAARRIAGPDLETALKLVPMGKLNLKAILMQADSGQVTVTLPLPRTVLEAGPVKIDLTGGHNAIINLDVDETWIDRKHTRGQVEPPIDLPLGAGFAGLYLDDDGDVIAEISGLPDLNLSRWVPGVPRVPETLDEALSMMFDRPKSDPAKSDRASGPRFDLSGLHVDARNLAARGLTPLRLGPGIELMLSDTSRLNVEYSRARTSIRGTAVLDGGNITGENFKIRHVSGRVTLALRIKRDPETDKLIFDLKASNLDVVLGELMLDLDDGTHLLATNVRLEDGVVDLDTSRTEGALRLKLPKVEGSFDGGRIVLLVDGKPTAADISPLALSGELELGDKLRLELSLGSLGIELDPFQMPFGESNIAIGGFELRGQARLTGDSRTGFELIGPFHTGLNLGGSHVRMEARDLSIPLVSGSRFQVEVERIQTGAGGLQQMDASGMVELRLGAASVPMGGTALSLKGGARGVLRLDRMTMGARGAWPHLDGMLRLEAATEAVEIGAFDAPAGRAHLATAFTIDGAGNLSLHDIELQVTDAD